MSAPHKKHEDNYTSLNRVELLRGGAPYFNRLLQMIADAKESIHLQTYIYDDDETGQLVATALKEAVKRNVQVYLLADGYASKNLSRAFINDIKKAGVHFRFFDPLFKSGRFYFGRRLHHKVVVTDTKFALVGGINISNRYNDMPTQSAWLDFALYMEGQVVKELCILCWKTWNGFLPGMGITPCEQKTLQYTIPPEQASEVSMRRNDWVRRKNEISATYVGMFRKAQNHITILCSYFLPGRAIRRQLAYAAGRGVSIKVITAGVSDVKLAKYAERYLYKWLLKHNIELYEYQTNILHGKIAIADSQWLTIGSYNINDISTYASIELNMNVRNPSFAKQTEALLNHIIEKDCIRITPEYYKQTRNIFKQFIRWCSYQFFRLTFYLFTFYYKHRK